jgi:hypothetical protein
MNDVRELCRRILDTPAPPMRDSAQVLAIARQAARRRARVTVAVGGLAAATTIAITAAATLPLAHRSAPPVQPVVSAPHTPAAGPPQAPTREAAGAHGDRIAQRLTDALPAGYTGRPGFDGRGTATWQPAGQPADRYVSQTRILVSSGAGEGSLSATLVGDGLPAPAGDLCAPAVATRFAAYFGDGSGNCVVTTIDGVRIRTVTLGSATTATRFLGGGLLVVGWTPSWEITSGGSADSRRPWWEPGGAGQPSTVQGFTATQLATLAADPRLLP